MIRTSLLPQNIALSLSGGGFRAAAFHLGVLDYLHRAKLLNEVRFLSTVSGGTITGARYALACRREEAFENFAKSYAAELANCRIFPQCLKLLASLTPLANDSQRKNLITCAAQIYSETIFADPQTKAPHQLRDLIDNCGPLREISFNATDFRTGLAFRFQVTKSGRIGNDQARVSTPDALPLRLGDIVAASSCFPGGFEPIVFPDDFVLGKESLCNIRATMKNGPSPLMDGGVYDNQGLESLVYAQKRDVPAQLFIFSDTDRKADSLFAMPEPVSRRLPWCLRLLNPTLGAVDAFVRSCLLMSVLAIIAFLLELWFRPPTLNIGEFTRFGLNWLVPFLVLCSTAALVALVRSTIQNSVLVHIPQLGTLGLNQAYPDARFRRKARGASSRAPCRWA